MAQDGQADNATRKTPTKAKKSRRDELVVERVRKRLLRKKGHWKAISRSAKGVLTYRWISAFAAGEIVDPSFTRLAVLARKLELEIGVMNGHDKDDDEGATSSSGGN